MLTLLHIAAMAHLLTLAASTSVSSTDKVLFTFTGGDYGGWQTWDWEAMTHLGFWTLPPSEVKEQASKHGVKLFRDCSTPKPKDWLDEDKRAAFAKGCELTRVELAQQSHISAHAYLCPCDRPYNLGHTHL